MVRPESVDYASGAVGDYARVHAAFGVSAHGIVRGVHVRVEDRRLRHNHHVMRLHAITLVAFVPPVVAVGHHPVDGVRRAGDGDLFRDVVAGEDVPERTVGDVGTDCAVVESVGDVASTPHRVVRLRTVRPSLKYALSVHLLLERPEAIKRYNFFYIHMIS